MKIMPSLLLFCLLTHMAHAAPHVLFMIGEHEYGTRESLPDFAEAELTPRGITYSLIFAKSDDRRSVDCHVFPGLADALSKADVLFVSVRRRFPPAADLALLKKWVADGKPVIGLRTSSHAFGEREKGQGYQAPAGHAAWPEFDREVFGVSYTGHVGSKTEAVVFAEREVQSLPIWDGVKLAGEVAVDSHLYYSKDLDSEAICLIRGKVKGTPAEEPVAWTLQKGKSRRFYTSLGSVEDMKLPFLRRLLVNAMYWSTGQAPSGAGAAKELKNNRTKEAHDDPLPAKGASRLLETPGDLKVELLLSEPVVEQPAFFMFDERGRMWVVQYRQYPEPAGLKLVSKDRFYRAVYDRIPAPPGHPDFVPGLDRISIHEDSTGDGQFDTTSTFLEGLNIVTSCAQGRGGVFVLQPPYLLFYADRNLDDVPDGPPEVLLEGFGIEDTHSVVNSLCWGPDGWLYGAQGSTVSSAVKVPGSKEAPVRRQGQLMWRYDPDEQRYEVFAEGGGNIWSCEFDDKGRLFAGTNGGEPGFHYLQHAYYQKNFGKHGQLSNPYAYGYLKGIAHPQFKRVTTSICIYEGAALPKRYDGALIWANPVIGRFGASTLEPDGLGFQGDYIDQLVTTDHRWFRPVYVDFGPDGALYFCDWYDQQVNHWRNYQGRISKKDGRIYRVSAANPIAPFDLNERSTSELLKLLNHPNRWFRETARRLIDDRPDKQMLVPQLLTLLKGDDPNLALEALWTLHLCGGFTQDVAMQVGLQHTDPHVRRWTVRLLADLPELEGVDALLRKVAMQDGNLEVRAQCASAALRMSDKVSLSVLEGLFAHPQDANDEHMPLLTWWVVEKLCRDRLEDLAVFFEQPGRLQQRIFVQHIAERLGKRLAADGRRSHVVFLDQLVQRAGDEGRAPLTAGAKEALRGRRLSSLPVRLARTLSGKEAEIAFRLRMRHEGSISQTRQALEEKETPPHVLIGLLEVLSDDPVEGLADAMVALLDHPDAKVRIAAIYALAPIGDPAMGEALINTYAKGSAEEQAVARFVLTSRLDWSLALVKLLSADEIPTDVYPALARFEHPAFSFVDTQSTPEDLDAEMARIRGIVQESAGDPYAGRIQFLARCAACHTLHHEGGQLGPDLTAYQRSDLDSLLTAMIYPDAELREGFETMHVHLKDGRLLAGFVVDEDPEVVILQAIGGREQVLAREKIARMTPDRRSIMPEGLLEGMKEEELMDLFSYLKASQPLSVK
ncbi:MAG: putative membrane-bound dehydrogenase-like protein [Kiritimatiellia bacterium]|jgi:putative membrane-bound dehydrogenase-like protein